MRGERERERERERKTVYDEDHVGSDKLLTIRVAMLSEYLPLLVNKPFFSGSNLEFGAFPLPFRSFKSSQLLATFSD